MANQAPPAVASPATSNPTVLRAYFSQLSDSARLALSQRRPWTELVDRASFARPLSVPEATSRIRKNWAYFRINYTVILVAVVSAFLVAHPVSLFMLCTLLAAWVFLYVLRTEPLAIGGRQYSEREVFLILAALSVVVVLLTSVGSLLMSAVVVGIAIVAAHGAFRVPDDLFLDEQESMAPAGGFLSFLGNALPRAPVAAQV